MFWWIVYVRDGGNKVYWFVLEDYLVCCKEVNVVFDFLILYDGYFVLYW